MSGSLQFLSAMEQDCGAHRWSICLGRGTPRIMVLTNGDRASDVALLRGFVWARLFGCELHVVRVVPLRTEVRLQPDSPHDDRLRHDSLEVARTQTMGWIRTLLGTSIPGDQLHLYQGGIVKCALSAARDLNAQFVLLSAVSSRHPNSLSAVAVRIALRLARRERRAVLIARPPSRTPSILGASDFSDPDYPALSWAAAVALRTQASLTLLHNARWPGAGAGTGAGMAMALSRAGADSKAIRDLSTPEISPMRDHLGQIANGLHTTCETAVTRELDPAAAILKTARRHDADVIVIGAHERCSFVDWPITGVAGRVARQARCSVLLAPLHVEQSSTGPTSEFHGGEIV